MQLKFNMLQSLRNDNGKVENDGGRTYKLKRSTLFFIGIFYKNKNVQPKIFQNIKSMLRTYQYPRLREEQFIFQCFYFPKSRKSALHNAFCQFVRSYGWELVITALLRGGNTCHC